MSKFITTKSGTSEFFTRTRLGEYIFLCLHFLKFQYPIVYTTPEITENEIHKVSTPPNINVFMMVMQIVFNERWKAYLLKFLLLKPDDLSLIQDILR